jgi:hypothetical protein
MFRDALSGEAEPPRLQDIAQIAAAGLNTANDQ